MKIKEKNATKRNANAESLQLNIASLLSDAEYPDIKDLAMAAFGWMTAA
jgi:hypothetical protein